MLVSGLVCSLCFAMKDFSPDIGNYLFLMLLLAFISIVKGDFDSISSWFKFSIHCWCCVLIPSCTLKKHRLSVFDWRQSTVPTACKFLLKLFCERTSRIAVFYLVNVSNFQVEGEIIRDIVRWSYRVLK